MTYLVIGNSQSSSDRMIMSNSKVYAKDRYKDTKGSPYFFNDWVIAEVYNQSGDTYKGLKLNYNVYEEFFEILDGEKYIVLDPTYYWCVKVDKEINPSQLKDSQDSVIFIRGLLENNERKFVHIIYNGSRVKLIRDPYAAESVKTIQNVGQTITNRRFNRKDTYFFLIDGEYSAVRLKKKEVINRLGHKKELEAFIKDNKLKMKKDEDYEVLLAYYESELMEK